MPDEPISIVILIVLLFLSAIMSATETAFNTANRFKIKVKAEDGLLKARAATWILKNSENSLVTLVILNNLVNLLITIVLTIILVARFGEGTGTVLTTVIAVPIVFLFGESLPKAIARRFADEWTMHASIIFVPFIVIVYPLSFLFKILIVGFKKIFKFKEDNIFSASDFEDVIESIEEKGIISEDSSDIILSSLEFSETIVKDVITPKGSIVAYDLKNYSRAKFHDFLVKTNFSRIPLYEGKIDNIVGVVVVREYIRQFVENPKTDIRKVMSEPYFVNSKISLTKMIEGFKKKGTHMAFVRDEKRNLFGMVTMEDVLEELVGQIAEPFVHLKEEEKNND